jgi:CopG antitoxin of type II toxin-antitoxin system
MTANRKGELPPTDSLADLVEFFDTHDMGEYWDRMPEGDFDIDLRRRKHLVTLEADLARKVAKIARSRHVSSESLINSLLREKLAEAS